MGPQIHYHKVRKGGSLLTKCIISFAFRISAQNLTHYTIGAINHTSFIVFRIYKGIKVVSGVVGIISHCDLLSAISLFLVAVSP